MTVLSRFGSNLNILHSSKLLLQNYVKPKGLPGYLKSFELAKCYSLSSRSLSPVTSREVAERPKTITKDDKREFMAIFPDVVRELTQNKEEREQPSDLSNLMIKCMQYNVSGGKNIRGLSVVYSFRMLASDEEYTPENIRRSQVLGWCTEMIQGFFIVIDDVADGSITRRGRPCWYKLPDVGLRAVSDAILLEAEAYHLIKKYCKDKKYYLPILELILDSTRKTSYGQVVDSLSPLKTLHELSMDRYNYITKYKTGYYTFHLPVAIGMYLAGIYNEELHRQAKIVLLEIGRYFQVQDDYLDVFGDAEVTGKIGTDIRDGKCTWLAIVAYQRASPAQRKILLECYGKDDAEKVAAVKDVYTQIGLHSLYHAFEEETTNLINRQIQQLSAGLPHELFLSILHKIHGRDK